MNEVARTREAHLARIAELDHERRYADAEVAVAHKAKLSDEELLPLMRGRLDAWRAWGFALGQPEPGGDRKSSVSVSLDLSDADKKDRERARKIAFNVDEATYEARKAATNPEELTIAALLRVAHVGRASGENEWYTPPEYIAAARRVMGAIDLDPASSKTANEIVGAGRIYTLEDNGLEKEWRGRVWMNPPYAQPLIELFCAKLVDSYYASTIEQACALVNNATETGWFHKLASLASAFCFPRGRLQFWHPERESATPLQGQAIVYFGTNIEIFREAFSFGFTART